eukprot:297075-Amphidinium_carterae.1
MHESGNDAAIECHDADHPEGQEPVTSSRSNRLKWRVASTAPWPTSLKRCLSWMQKRMRLL